MLLLLSALVVAGCGGEGEEKTYPLRGTIEGRIEQSNELVVQHEKIGDWMEAMTMPFPVRDAKVAELPPTGTEIEAIVHVTDRRFWITDVRPVEDEQQR